MSRNEALIPPLPISPNSSILPVAPVVTSPTEFVDLPTLGRFYSADHPLSGKSQVEIREMSAKEEDILTNKTLLRKGIAIDRMLQSLLIDQSIKISTLFVPDKNALVIAARISGLGKDYAVKTTCQCDEPLKIIFDLIEDRRIFVGSPDIGDDGRFLILLPRTNHSVLCRLLTGQDELNLAQTAENKRKHNLGEIGLTDQMKLFVVSIDGNEDRKYISDTIDRLPASDARHLRSNYALLIPNIEITKKEVLCEVCGQSQNVPLTFSADFFWPKQ